MDSTSLNYMYPKLLNELQMRFLKTGFVLFPYPLPIEENIQITIFHKMLYKDEWGHLIWQINHKIGYKVSKHSVGL